MKTIEELQKLAADSANIHFNMKHEGDWYAHYYGYIYGYQQAEQHLKQRGVSGSDPLYDLAKEIGFGDVTEEDLRNVIEKMKGERSASGAVDTVAEGEEREVIVKPIPTAEYKLTISKIEKVTREAPSGEQP